MTPEILNGLAEIAVAIVSLAITIATPILVAYVKRYTGVKIQEKHMKALHEAALTWANDAVKRGVGPASANLVEDFTEYAWESVPDAMSSLGGKEGVLRKIAMRYLEPSLERFMLSSGNAGPAPAR